jgi:RHS repeat-associated protein
VRGAKTILSVSTTAALVVTLAVASPAQAAPQPPAAAPPAGAWSPPETINPAVPEYVEPEEDWATGRAQFQADARAEFGAEQRRGSSSVTVGAPGLGEMPWFSFHDFALSAESTAQVNLANGNLLVKAQDLAIAGPGYSLRHDRFYNSLSTEYGSLGLGWGSNNGAYDSGLVIDSSGVTFFGPNGVELHFARVGTSTNFTPPAGSNMTLTENTSSVSARYVITHNKSGDRQEFDSSGFLTAAHDRNGVGTTFVVDGETINSATHSSGRSLYFNYFQFYVGNFVNDDAAREVQYTNDFAQLIGVTAVDGEVTTYEYNTENLLSGIELPSAVAAGSTSVEFEYDTSNRITKVTQAPGIETTFAYAAGQTVVTDSNGNAATYFIDAEGRVTSARDALNRERSQAWTANSDIESTTDALGTNTTTYTYDPSGNRTSAELPTGAAASAVYAIGPDCGAPNTGTAFQPKCSTDDAGNSKQYEYDAAGNLLKQSDTTGATAAVEFEQTFGTCGGFAGQVCTTTDGNGNTTTYGYDTSGNLTIVAPPGPLGSTTYTHDSLGRITSVTDGNGDTTAFTYDVRDRVLQATFDNTQTLTSTYYPNGLEETRTDSAGGVISFEYDHQGRILEQTGPRPGVTQTYTYDEVGNILTYADGGGTTTYTYDIANQLISLREPSGTCPTSGNPAANSGCILFEYDDNALESKRILPGGATTTTTRDAAGRATRITATAADTTIGVDIGYTYTAAGTTDDRANIQSRTAFKEQGITAGAVTAYTYDSRNRLTLAEEKVGTTTTASWGYAFDANGNRTSQIRSGSTGATAGTINYGYNAANQLTSATGQTTTWTYDAAGNQTRNGLTGITSGFGDRGETSTIDGTSNGYFGVGNFDRTSSGTLTFNSGALGLMQRSTPTVTHNYTRTPDGQAVGLRGSSRHYYIQDHLGSTVGLFNGAGAYAGGYSYSPYGEARATSTNSAVVANNLRYIGGHQEGANVYKLGARYYDANLGRFTQMDPTGQEANPYSYTAGDPINYLDPSGTSLAAAWDLVMLLSDLRDIQQLFDLVGTDAFMDKVYSVVAGAITAALCQSVFAIFGVATGGLAFFVVSAACYALGDQVGRLIENG